MFHTRTHVGQKREANEDDVLATSFDGTELLIVADGMGGYTAGDVASNIATTKLKEEIERELPVDRSKYEPILRGAIAEANEKIHIRTTENPSLSGMGTTVVAAIIDDGEATIANVGDSRAYHIDNGIERVTVDQSLVQELLNQGEITESEAREHPHRNVLSQALGTAADVEPDLYRQTVSGTLLLCSDGLIEEVSETRIAEIVATEPTLADTAKALIRQANENGGADNITVALYSEPDDSSD